MMRFATALATCAIFSLAATTSEGAIVAGDVLSIDINSGTNSTASGDNWNNWGTGNGGDGDDVSTEGWRFDSHDPDDVIIADLIRRSDGASTGVSWVGTEINNTTDWGTETSGTNTNTNGTSFPDSAVGDIGFTVDEAGTTTGDGTVVWEFRNLDPLLTYDFEFFGAIGGSADRLASVFTETTTGGGSASDSYQPKGNTSDVAMLSGLSPDVSGTIEITWGLGAASGGSPTSSIINLIQVSAIPEPAALALLGVGSLLIVGGRRRKA